MAEPVSSGHGPTKHVDTGRRSAEGTAQAGPSGNPQGRLLRTLRRVVLAVAFLGAYYLFSRYTLFDLPTEGCSPLWNVAPGDRLVLDTWEREPSVGDGVVVRAADGSLHLGRVLAAPAGTDTGALWIGYDDANCPGYDSSLSGAIPAEDVVGRILLVL